MAEAYADILYGKKGQVARITINRPRQYNAIRRLVVGRAFWAEEQEGARAFLEKRKPDFSRFRRRR